MHIIKEFPKFFPSQELFIYDGLTQDHYKMMKFLCENIKEVINSKTLVQTASGSEYTQLAKGTISFYFSSVKKKFGKVRLSYVINIAPPPNEVDTDNFVSVTKEISSRIRIVVSTLESLLNLK